MSYKRMSASEMLKKPRRMTPKFEGTREWELLRADLDKGLKPGEALQVLLTDEDKRKYRIKNRRTVARFIQKYLDDHQLTYFLRSFHREEGDYFQVYAPEVHARRRS